MKKVLLSLAVMAGVSIFANAGNVTECVSAYSETVIAASDDEEDGFVEVKIEDLNDNVKKAIEAYSETDTVKTVAYNAEKKQTKAVLVSKADSSEKEVIFDDEGKEVVVE